MRFDRLAVVGRASHLVSQLEFLLCRVSWNIRGAPADCAARMLTCAPTATSARSCLRPVFVMERAGALGGRRLYFQRLLLEPLSVAAHWAFNQCAERIHRRLETARRPCSPATHSVPFYNVPSRSTCLRRTTIWTSRPWRAPTRSTSSKCSQRCVNSSAADLVRLYMLKLALFAWLSTSPKPEVRKQQRVTAYP